MAAELGIGYLSVVPETSKIAPGIKKAFRGVDPIAEKGGSRWGGKITGGISTALKGSVAAVGATAGGLLGVSMAKGFGRLASIDMAQAKLKGLGHDAETVSSIMDDSLKSVKGTAHGLEEAATTSSMMVAAGIKPGEQLEQVLKTVGDTASMAGRSMADTGLIFGSIAARGKLQGDDMLQLMSSGVPVLQLLGDELGKTSGEVSKMVSKGEIDFETFEKAMRKGVGGAALAMGDTFDGSLKNVGAALGRFGAMIEKPIFSAAPPAFKAFGAAVDALNKGISPAAEKIEKILTPALSNLATETSEKLSPKLEVLGGKIGDVALKFTEAAVDPENWRKIGEVVSPLADSAKELAPAMGQLGGSMAIVTKNISVATWQAFGSVLNASTPLIENVLVPLVKKAAEFSEQNPGKVQAIVTAFLGFKALGTVAGPAKSFVKTMGKVTGTAKKAHGVLKVFRRGSEIGGLKSGLGAATSMLKGLSGPFSKAAGRFKTFGKALSKIGRVAVKAGRFLKPVVSILSKAVIGHPVIAGITLAATALSLFFTKTETGRKLMAGFIEKMKAAGEWLKTTFTDAWGKATDFISSAGEVLKNVFHGIFEVGKITVGVIGTVVLTPLILAWNLMSAIFKGAWENVIKPVWNGLKDAALLAWNEGLKPAFEWIKNGFKAVGDWFVGVYNGYIKPVFDWFGSAANWVWQNLLKPAWDGIKNGWELLGNFFVGTYNEVIKPVLDMFGGAATWLWENAISPAWEGIKSGFSWVGNGIQWVVNNIVLPAWEQMKNGLNWLRDSFHKVVETIGGIWDGLRSKLAKPINFMINHVINGGVVKAWNAVGRFIDLPEATNVATIPEHATGGQIKGPGGIDNVLMWGTAGEHMLTVDEVRKAGGHAAVYLLRDLIARGIPFSWDHGHILSDIGSRNVQAYGNQVKTKGIGKATPEGLFGMLPAHKDGGEIRPAWKDQLRRGHEYAIKYSPRPYVWGGSTFVTGGTDCSGWMSEIADVILGGSGGHRQWATGSFPGPQKGAWESGLGQGFSVGISNVHTAGTLSGVDEFNTVNVESGGNTGQGNTYAGPSAGADHPQFPQKWHLKIGADGAFESAGGPSIGQMVDKLRAKVAGIFDTLLNPVRAMLPAPPPEWQTIPGHVLDTTGKKAREHLFGIIPKLGHKLRGSFDRLKSFGNEITSLFRDNGGWLPRGMSVVRNETGRPEAVLNWQQLDSIQALLSEAVKLVTSEAATVRNMVYGQAGNGSAESHAFLSVWHGSAAKAERAEEQLAAARAKVADQVEKLSDAEKAVADAQEELVKAQKETGLSDSVVRRLQDAEEGLAKARATGKPGKVADAEKKLARAREDAEKEQQKAGEKRSEAIKKAEDKLEKSNKRLIQQQGALVEAQNARAKAEEALLDPQAFVDTVSKVFSITEKFFDATPKNIANGFFDAAQMAADMSGNAFISAGVRVSRAVVGFAFAIADAVHQSRTKTAALMAESASHVRAWVDAVAKQQQQVAKLRVAIASQSVELMGKIVALRGAWLGVARAELEGRRGVADARKKLTDYMQTQAATEAATLSSLTGQLNRYRGFRRDDLMELHTMQSTMTDERLALEHEVKAAELERYAAIGEAQKKQLTAALDFKKTAWALADSVREVVRAQATLDRMNQNESRMGLKQEAAIALERIFKLESDNAQMLARRDWHAKFTDAYKAITTNVERNEEEIRDLLDTYKIDLTSAEWREVQEARNKAKTHYLWGQEEEAKQILKATVFGDAQRLLERAKVDEAITQAGKDREDVENTINRGREENAINKRLIGLDQQIGAFGQAAESNRLSAEALRESNEGLRQAINDLATHYAESARVTAQPVSTTTNVDMYMPADKSAFSAAEVRAMLDKFNSLDDLNVRVHELEDADKVGASSLIHDRR